MKDYSAMSDFEINKAVGELTGEATSTEPTFEMVIRNANGRRFNPCNNPFDAWPIIFRERITLTPKVTGYEWDAISPVILNDGIEHLHTDKNPLRAAMIVYLMMRYCEK
ncbi:hypothetical protein vBYenSP400_15 [Yersinia phage vB_YenS_P400]|nr:hypothetical protein vBYenSP400_15 [Yersinia phage vB_YenS_P400]